MDEHVELIIRDTVMRYGALLDARRIADVAGCLATDVQADYDGRLFHGRDEVMHFLMSGANDLLMVYHFIGSINTNTNPAPSAEIYVQSFAVRRAEPSALLARGCRWIEEYSIEDDRCVISRSVHRTDWAVEYSNAVFTPSAKRLTWEGLG